MTIYTTIDPATQEAAEIAAQNKVDQAGQEFEVSLVAIDPDNGHIKAMIGGDDSNYDNAQGNMATGEGTGGRQPGSSFKTFTLATAIEKGIDPQTIIDAGATMEVPGSADVSNFGHYDYGMCTISKAFAVSSNTAFTRLILSVGVDSVIDMARRLGIDSDLPAISA